VLEVYRLTAEFPSDERFGLSSQLRRAAYSVPANIAEGSKRAHRKDYARFLNIAEGSASELAYFVILARDLGLLDRERSDAILTELVELEKMLCTLRQKVEPS